MVRLSSPSIRISASVLLCFGAFSPFSTANAQTTTQVTTTSQPAVPAPPPPPPTTVVVQPTTPVAVATTRTTSAPVEKETREEGYMPNRYLLTTGLILWGVPYVSGLVVASQSSNSADQHLYVPIVGPWLDLGQRPSCPAGNNACNSETTNKVLLVGDGILQAVGTLEVFWGFLRPEHREVTTIAATRYTPKITLSPSQVASGYGLTALAQF